MTFVGNNTTGYGGATFSTGDLTLNYCTFISNQSINGGALYSGGTADIFNVNFDGNSAGSGNGGAIYNDGTLNPRKIDPYGFYSRPWWRNL